MFRHKKKPGGFGLGVGRLMAIANWSQTPAPLQQLGPVSAETNQPARGTARRAHGDSSGSVAGPPPIDRVARPTGSCDRSRRATDRPARPTTPRDGVAGGGTEEKEKEERPGGGSGAAAPRRAAAGGGGARRQQRQRSRAAADRNGARAAHESSGASGAMRRRETDRGREPHRRDLVGSAPSAARHPPSLGALRRSLLSAAQRPLPLDAPRRSAHSAAPSTLPLGALFCSVHSSARHPPRSLPSGYGGLSSGGC